MELRVGISQAAIEQWGNLWAGYTEVLNWYFPLTTSQVYAVCLTKHTKNISSGHNWEPARIEEWNNSYARIHPDGDLGYSVIAICKAQQQWGFDSGTAEKNIVILPLPVINPLSGFACLTDSNGAGDIGIKSMSSTSIVVDVDTNKAASRNFYWLVIAL